MALIDPALQLKISTQTYPAMLASIILVAYNSQSDLRICLDSLNKTLPNHCEILLLDNASKDSSADLVESDYPGVKVIRSATNLGYAGGNNQAATMAKGDFLVFINPDTRVEAGWLEALLAPLQADSFNGLATPKILLMQDPKRINTCGNDIHLSGLTLCRGAGLSRERLDQPSEVSAVSGAAFALRRELFVKLGGFDETFFTYMEDSDLSWRARQMGYRCIYTPEAVIYHDYTLHFGPLKTFYQERNRSLMLLKNLHWGSLVALLPVLLLAELITWGFVLLFQRDQWKQKFEVYAWIARHWNEILAKRSRIRRLRMQRDRDLLRLHTWRLAFEQTGPSLQTGLVHVVFDPLFWVFYGLARLLIWW
jgi:GT2 family glycosyltransferase